MAKSKAKVAAADYDEATGETGEAKNRGIKRVVINVNGEDVSRVEYIRKRFQEGAKRGEIAKELSEIQGKPVKYQIVFAATKGMSETSTEVAVAEEA